MSIHLSPPRTRQPLMTALRGRADTRPRLSDFPHLALAASITTAPLDINSATFAALAASFETLARLRLSASSAWLLMLLLKHGAQSCSEMMGRMKVSSAAITQLITRLEALGLLTIERGGETDRRLVMITATEAARKVLASVLALTELSTAAGAAMKLFNHAPKEAQLA